MMIDLFGLEGFWSGLYDCVTTGFGAMCSDFEAFPRSETTPEGWVSEILTDALHSDKPFDPNDEELICGHIRCFTPDGEISRETFLRETANKDIGKMKWLARGIDTSDEIAAERAEVEASLKDNGVQYAIDLPNPTHGFVLDGIKAWMNCYLVEVQIQRSMIRQTSELLDALKINNTEHQACFEGHSFGGLLCSRTLARPEFSEGGMYHKYIKSVTTYGGFGFCRRGQGVNYVATWDFVPWLNLRNWIEYYKSNSDYKIVMIPREPGSSWIPHDYDGPTYRHAREMSRKGD
jgi:hypothetical protein